MSEHSSRRAFLGKAAAVAVIPAAGGAAAAIALGEGSHPAAGRPSARKAPKPRKVVPENALPGDPSWNITHPGPTEAIMGYAGQASVLAGEQVPLFVSTT